uniref:Palmitoyltransferase ZDHHC13 (Trinotate prediction) n=1 Tax=Myxobolus squamalis TaxID=59785 RepID=A0A6B2FX13_MYXSQ
MYSTSNAQSISCTRILFSFCWECVFDHDCVGNTALHLAVLYDNLNCVDFLVNHCFDILKTNFSKESPVDLAIKYSKKNIISYFENEISMNRLSSHRKNKYLISLAISIIPIFCQLTAIFSDIWLNIASLLMIILFLSLIISCFLMPRAHVFHIPFGISISPLFSVVIYSIIKRGLESIDKRTFRYFKISDFLHSNIFYIVFIFLRINENTLL